MPSPPPRRHVLGIDWSGARRAGRHIWVAEGRLTGSRGLSIERVRSLAELTGADPDPASATRALRAWLLQPREPFAAGFDFPFGLPIGLLGSESWRQFVTGFRGRFDSPEGFRAWCRDRAGGRELRRLTDRKTRTPFSAYNLRMYRQTYWGLAGVLGPMVASARASALPMQRPAADRPWLLETCPASWLKARSLYAPYKGAGAARRGARDRLLSRLVDAGDLEPMGRDGVELCRAPGADGLDAVIAALATADALRAPGFPRPDWEPEYAREAMVYA